jgi:sugar O-acyltransferase (sialic acid O-acetyltransferase NeuD family)
MIPSVLTSLHGPRHASSAAKDRVAVIGAGGHGRVVASCLLAAGKAIAGFWDDDPAKHHRRISGAIVEGAISDLAGSDLPAIIAIGDNEVRKRISRDLGLDWASAIHPAAWVDPSAVLGRGTVVCAGAIVQPGSMIGAHAIVNSRAGVDHDASLGDYAHVSAAHLGAGAHAGEGALLGIGSVVLPFRRVGRWTTVGAGAVVTHDVPDGMTVVGNPARPVTTPRAADRRRTDLPMRSDRPHS